MLSYQHSYHAGNLADVHKHALLAWMLAYLAEKPKPLTYIETHAGRGLYDLGSAEASKTGEAAAGIGRAAALFDPAHPYARVLDSVRARHGAQAYPGSPLIAATLLRPDDRMHFAELHLQEYAGLQAAIAGAPVRLYRRDGFEMAQSILPPTPRRGLLLIDPSYEVKSDYEAIPRRIAQMNKAWNVGILALWYPLLADRRHRPMLAALRAAQPDAFHHEVDFPPARAGHGMTGSGLFVIRPPFGLAEEARRVDTVFRALKSP